MGENKYIRFEKKNALKCDEMAQKQFYDLGVKNRFVQFLMVAFRKKTLIVEQKELLLLDI